ncbi:MAG: HAMP domain-containing histidine kinase [Chloroflexia bacterium]|nr:HAMP domain-containing histidine kinase [Chloroflexia bacterium]
MKRLWIQLTLSFGLVALTAIVTVALLANTRAATTFRGYVVRSQVADSGLIGRLERLYSEQGSWEGVETILAAQYGPGQGRGAQGSGAPRSSVALADAQGRLIADPNGIATSNSLNVRERNNALPITVANETVGYLLVSEPRGGNLPGAAERFLEDLNDIFWWSALLAASIGLVLGLLLARSLTAPLNRLAHGARRIAQGQLDERVPPGGPTEVSEVAEAFNAMAASLQAGETERRHMVADIAHELRTPLTVVQGNLRAMLDDVYPLSKSEVATIYDTTLSLRRLVDDLRELSLAEAGQLELHLSPTAIGPLLERTVTLFEELAASQQITLSATYAPELPMVTGDAERLTQVLRNLVSNALHHTPAGGTITLRATAEGSLVQIVVEDNGTGIAADDLPHIFERFYRADRSRSRDRGGSGLGLAITQQLIKLHNGMIGVTSEPGQGACFWFTLPVA